MAAPTNMTRKSFLAAIGGGAMAAGNPPAETKMKSNRKTTAGETELTKLVCLDDFEAEARRVMASSVYDYVSGGAGDGFTVRWNRERYQELRLASVPLVDVSQVDCSTTLFGQKMRMPILVAPTSNHRLVHPEGELETARGAGLAGATMVLSNGANTSVEDVLRVATHPVWMQFYMPNDRGFARDFIQRAEKAGAKALCATVDGGVDGPRNRSDRNPITMPPGVNFPNYPGGKSGPYNVTLDEVHPPRLEWRDLEWIRAQTKLPLLLKGIMNPTTVENALRIGANGIVVSNHGGRCLDTQPATIEVLPGIVEKVAGRVPVLVDGGIRRGTDVVKALALGASAVQLGRPVIYGLAVGGAAGVTRVIKLLRQELLLAMALLGRPTLASLDRSVIWR